jgi:hypothetical protein
MIFVVRYGDALSLDQKAMRALALLSTGCLAFNFFAIAVFADELFGERAPLSGLGWMILAGFALVLIFNLSCIIWSAYHLNTTGSSAAHVEHSHTRAQIAPELFAFGIISTILMAGEKVMIDEIGRETILGWETAGEWIILCALLSAQLMYTLFTATRLLDGLVTTERTFDGK